LLQQKVDEKKWIIVLLAVMRGEGSNYDFLKKKIMLNEYIRNNKNRYEQIKKGLKQREEERNIV